MKKFLLLFVLAFATTISVKAQKHHKGEKLSTEQLTTLMVKKMTLELDLTASQQRQIRPIIAKRIAEKKAKIEQMKANKESKKELSADERFERASNKIDKQMTMKSEMKKILNDEQLEKLERMRKGKKKKSKKGHLKKRKSQQ